MPIIIYRFLVLGITALAAALQGPLGPAFAETVEVGISMRAARASGSRSTMITLGLPP